MSPDHISTFVKAAEAAARPESTVSLRSDGLLLLDGWFDLSKAESVIAAGWDRKETEVSPEERAKLVMARMLLAGDDGTWSGETDTLKVHQMQTDVLSAAIREAEAAVWEEAAKAHEERSEHLRSVVFSERKDSLLSLENDAWAEKFRLRRDASAKEGEKA